MILSWGELVWDEIAGSSRCSLGGVACAIATQLQELGATARLVSAIGDDAYGARALNELEQRSLDAQWIQSLPGALTARVRVELEASGPRYSGLARLDWSRVAFASVLERALVGADALVFALFFQGTTAPLDELERALAGIPRPRWVGCDLNLRHEVNYATIEKVLTLVDFVKLNEAELTRLADICQVRDVAEFLLQNHENIAFIVETLGPGGARLLRRHGGVKFEAPVSAPAAHSLGAGDALMAALVYALVRGAPAEAALEGAVRYASEHVERASRS